ncbi:MAG: 30S ribosomal protein S4 [Candidatus Omnitrophota bacterium]
MARYTGSVCRLCRTEGTKLFFKSTRCLTEKCAFNKRAYSPGQHGKKRSKLSDYALQLREKQKVRRVYGVSEQQFRRYFKNAEKSRSVTGTVLLQSLERRLDSVVFNLGFALTRAQARQMVKHNFLLVNARPVNVPSYLVRPKDILSIRNDEAKRKKIREIVKLTKDKEVPVWLQSEPEKLEGAVLRLPERADIRFPVREQLIVELYSK